ncbi:hypothetical protein VT50_0234890 [Streptomyces antioxidans]|uniref:DUF4190 domain-containing protein n=1 Tax=Streptomyces antioxidans TaxID=1507734 RepID=A0A1V4CV05_9ACTN|nr:hypothetical protein [Streptomyces antioxidans]OPF71201.1 hypothetical protein VT50_0234890 [Streptomyces antioxidans]
MSESTVSGRSDSPAVALGPTALVLGVFAAVGAWVPAFVFVVLPWAAIAGPLAIVLGAMGVHHARRGAGRLWIAVVGTGLGAVGFAGTVTLLWLLGG